MDRMESAIERMAEAVETLIEIRIHNANNSKEVEKLRETSHTHGNKLQEIDALKTRVCKLETHEELREDELKKSFAKRDDRINNLSKIVYIGTGIVIVLQVVLPIFLLRGGQ